MPSIQVVSENVTYRFGMEIILLTGFSLVGRFIDGVCRHLRLLFALIRAGRIGRSGALGFNPATLGVLAMVECVWPKGVSVCTYTRIRFGRIELVRSHCRSLPSR